MTYVSTWQASDWKPTHVVHGFGGPQEVQLLHTFEVDGTIKAAVVTENGYVSVQSLDTMQDRPLQAADVGIREKYWAPVFTTGVVGGPYETQSDARGYHNAPHYVELTVTAVVKR